MTDLALQLKDSDRLGRVAGVDTSKVWIDVDDPILLTRFGVGNLIAIKGITEREYLIGITERVTRMLAEDILEEEKKARERIDSAKEKAKQMRIEAEEKAKEVRTKARKEAIDEAKAFIAKTEEEAQKQKEEELQQAYKKIQSLWSKDQEPFKKAVDALSRILLGEINSTK